MTRKGKAPNDYRSEAERIRTRPAEPGFQQEYNWEGRAPEHVNPGSGVRYGPEASRPSGDENPDKTSRREIVRLLSAEPELATSDISVEVQDGIALLQGSVDTMNTKYRVEEISKRVDRITSVNNQLTVRAGAAMDEFTRGSAAARLHDESTLEGPTRRPIH
jgi:hypothetical protein